MTSLDGLATLTSIGGLLNLTGNYLLTDITGIQNINPATISNLFIRNHSFLSYCDLPNICIYLTDLNNPATILLNKLGCESREAIEVNCASVSTEMAGDERNSIILFPNPTSGIMTISGIDPLEHASARITDTMGKRVSNVLLSSHTIDLSGNPNGWHLVTITTNNQQVIKRVFKKE